MLNLLDFYFETCVFKKVKKAYFIQVIVSQSSDVQTILSNYCLFSFSFNHLIFFYNLCIHTSMQKHEYIYEVTKFK